MTKFFIAATFIFSAVALLPAVTVSAQENHEYAKIEEKKIDYRDWTFKNLQDETPVNLRQWTGDKRLVLVVYFASWCPNWRYEAPVVAKLYDKYKTQGFDVVAVSEYASRKDAQTFFGDKGLPYTVVVESESRDSRDKTTHYAYRRRTDDKRNWGSPYNVFLEPAKLAKEGEVLTEKAWVVNGELIEKNAEDFIRARLGLDKKEAATPQQSTKTGSDKSSSDKSSQCVLELGPTKKQ